MLLDSNPKPTLGEAHLPSTFKPSNHLLPSSAAHLTHTHQPSYPMATRCPRSSPVTTSRLHLPHAPALLRGVAVGMNWTLSSSLCPAALVSLTLSLLAHFLLGCPGSPPNQGILRILPGPEGLKITGWTGRDETQVFSHSHERDTTKQQVSAPGCDCPQMCTYIHKYTRTHRYTCTHRYTRAHIYIQTETENYTEPFSEKFLITT